MPPAGMPRPEAATFAAWVRSLETALDRAAAAAPKSGASGAGAPVESRRVHQRGSRSPGARGRRPSAAAGRRLRLRLRQHRRRAVGVARPARALHARGGEDQPPGARRPDAAADDRRPTRSRRCCCRTIAHERGPAVRIARRHCRPSPLPARRRIRHQGRSVAESRRRARSAASTRWTSALDRAAGRSASTVDAAKARHGQRQGAASKCRVPVKAGTRLVSVSLRRRGRSDAAARRASRAAAAAPRSPTSSTRSMRPSTTFRSSARTTARCRETRASRERIFVCQPATAREEEGLRAPDPVGALARRAYRRPVTDADIEAAADGVRRRPAPRVISRTGIQWALEAVLVSPKFLFRVEQDPAGAARATRIGSATSSWRRGCRSSSGAAFPTTSCSTWRRGARLKQPAVLEQQVRADAGRPAVAALVDNFAGQWLYLRNLRSPSPNADLFPEFDDNLREALPARDGAVPRRTSCGTDRSVVELLTANYTFVNERLARHYGIPERLRQPFPPRARIPTTGGRACSARAAS